MDKFDKRGIARRGMQEFGPTCSTAPEHAGAMLMRIIEIFEEGRNEPDFRGAVARTTAENEADANEVAGILQKTIAAHGEPPEGSSVSIKRPCPLSVEVEVLCNV